MAEEHMLLPHSLTLSERNDLRLTGATEVVSFDEHTIVLRTSLGALVVQGQGLQLNELAKDGGQVRVAGTVQALIYEDNQPSGGWLRRIWG